MTHASAPVRRRQVFYIPGYDPFHPRRYRELYRKEAAEQAKISGYSVEIKRKPTGQSHGWTVQAQIDGARVDSDIDVLVWSDLVRASMSNGILATYWQLLRTAWIYISTGALFRLMRLRKGPMLAVAYPVFVLLAQLGLAVLLGRVVAQAVGPFVPVPGLDWVVLGAVAWAVLSLCQRYDRKIYAYYLMHDFAHTASVWGAYPQELEARLDTFAERVTESLRSDVDEVLLVGHSSGAHLAVSVLARLPEGGAPVSLLTLGHVVPMVSFLPKAKGLRRDLQALSRREDVFWLDVTAPGDGCSFALCDPVRVSGIDDAGSRWPLIVSAAFTQTLSPARWKALRWRFFRLHFQYLCAFDRPGQYDYFKITAGPESLAERFAERSPSPSVITAPVSGYRSTA